MQLASDAFSKGDSQKALQIYTEIILNNSIHSKEALLNKASVLYSLAQYDPCILDLTQFIEDPNQEDPIKVEAFLLYGNCIVKKRALLTPSFQKILEEGKKAYPYHKKYLDILKTIDEIQIVEDDEQFMDKVFEKLMGYPKIREFMKDESFLTKVEKMIRNPSLSAALIKMDGRLVDVQ